MTKVVYLSTADYSINPRIRDNALKPAPCIASTRHCPINFRPYHRRHAGGTWHPVWALAPELMGIRVSECPAQRAHSCIRQRDATLCHTLFDVPIPDAAVEACRWVKTPRLLNKCTATSIATFTIESLKANNKPARSSIPMSSRTATTKSCA